jgi:zinc transport system ATP-binding protein
MTLISLRDVSVRLGGHPALRHVDLDLSKGEIVTIVGPNGSGKSTLLRVIIGAVIAQSGQVTRVPDLRIGYVPQTLALDPTLPMTVARMLSLPIWRKPAAIARALTQAGVPDLAGRQLAELSGGQFQRVLLARALMDAPHVLLLDEPTQGLDQPGAAAFYSQIEQVRRDTGVAVLMVSHELNVVMRASDRVICLNGHVCCHGTPEVVASDPEYRAWFGTGAAGALALYRHDHDHAHDGDCDHDHPHAHPHGNVA